MSALGPGLGVLAGLVGVVGTIPYIRDTIRRSTHPHRGTWLIWSALAFVILLSQRADGASWSLLMVGGQLVVNACVLVLAARLGTGGVSAADAGLLALATCGVAGWAIVGEPVLAIACVVAADLAATVMMVPKTLRDPGSETLSTFAWASLAGALAAGSVGAPEPSQLLYPAYYCLANAALAALIWHGREARRQSRRLLAPAVPHHHGDDDEGDDGRHHRDGHRLGDAHPPGSSSAPSARKARRSSTVKRPLCMDATSP